MTILLSWMNNCESFRFIILPLFTETMLKNYIVNWKKHLIQLLVSFYSDSSWNFKNDNYIQIWANQMIFMSDLFILTEGISAIYTTNTDYAPICFCADLLNSIKVISHMYSGYHNVNKMKAVRYQISLKNISMIVMFTSSHVRIFEKADKAAKFTSHHEIPNFLVVAVENLERRITRTIQSNWNSLWHESPLLLKKVKLISTHETLGAFVRSWFNWPMVNCNNMTIQTGTNCHIVAFNWTHERTIGAQCKNNS